MSVQFTPEDAIGVELKANLTNELKARYNSGEDASDIAEFIVILIVSNNTPEQVLKEVKEIADIPIDVPFIESVFREAQRISEAKNQPPQPQEQPVHQQQPVEQQQQHQQPQEPQQPQQPQQAQPPQQQQQQQAPESALPPAVDSLPSYPQSQAQAQLFQNPQQFFQNLPPVPGPNGQLPSFPLPPFPTNIQPGSAPVGLPTGPRSLQKGANRNYDSRNGVSKPGRGGIGKNAANGRNAAGPGGRKSFQNPSVVQKVLGAANANTTNVTRVSHIPKGRCADFPYCNNKECEFAHPTKNCFQYPNCPNPPGTCNFLHPDQDQELIAKLEKSKQEFHQKRAQRETINQATCKFGAGCTKDTCPFAHPTPANAHAEITTLDWCPAGKGCIDSGCGKAHPPPPSAKPVSAPGNPQAASEIALEQCKFGLQCTNYKCPRRHATSLVPCRAGASCKRLDCTFAHPFKEECRFGEKCSNKNCLYQHPQGREIQSNTWSKDTVDTSTQNRAFAVPQDQVMEQAVQD